MLQRQFDAGTESGSSMVGRSTDISGSKRSSIWAVVAILSIFLYFGYTLNPLLNSAYHEAQKWRWDCEEKYHNRLRDAWTTEKRQHEELRIQMDHERKAMEEERRRIHDEQAGISWEGLEAREHCLRYATREYTANLTHVPVGLDALEECRNKPIQVHGKFVLPSLTLRRPGTNSNLVRRI